jgi:hypothetical protein
MKQNKDRIKVNKRELIPFSIGLPEISISAIIVPKITKQLNRTNSDNLKLKTFPLISKIAEEIIIMRKNISRRSDMFLLPVIPNPFFIFSR